MRDSTIVYRSFFEAIKNLPKENQADVWGAVFEFAFNFKEIELNGIEKTVFMLIKPQIQANNRKYKNGKKPKAKRKQNGSTDEAKDKQSISKSEANDNVNDNVNGNDNYNENDNNNANVTFDTFWKLYDYKKGSKEKVSKKWGSLSDAEREAIIKALPEYIQSTPDKQFRKHPATYLNNKSWEDEIIINSTPKEKVRPPYDPNDPKNQW